jgi:hypothetical protein
VTFTFASRGGGEWKESDQETLDAFRATGDFDNLKACGPPVADGGKRRLTMCESHRPEFLLDGLRLYSIAALDTGYSPVDRAKLDLIEAAPSCPQTP